MGASLGLGISACCHHADKFLGLVQDLLILPVHLQLGPLQSIQLVAKDVRRRLPDRLHECFPGDMIQELTGRFGLEDLVVGVVHGQDADVLDERLSQTVEAADRLQDLIDLWGKLGEG